MEDIKDILDCQWFADGKCQALDEDCPYSKSTESALHANEECPDWGHRIED